MNPTQTPGTRQGVTNKPVVEVKAVTWDKDSHGLFDYENSYYDMRKFQIAKPVLIGRSKNEINCWGKGHKFTENNKDETEFLLSISQDNEKRSSFWVDVPGDFTNKETFPTRHNFLIVRSLKCKDGRNQRGYSLNPGEVIKLGRVEFKVREIKVPKASGEGFDVRTAKDDVPGFMANSIKNQTFEQRDNQDNILLDNPQSLKADCENAEDEGPDCMANLPNDKVFDATEQALETSNNPNLTCRYCFQRDISDDHMQNLLINPCDCKGSSGMVHLLCLMNWIQYKIISKTTSNIATYQWKKLQCEVCTRNWPRSVRFGEEVRSLISVEKPPLPYIILEKQNTDPGTGLKANSLSLIVATDASPIKLGRGHQCDLRISDISVSRIHAFLKYENNNFLIFDNDSKFGTLIKLNKPYMVQTDKAAVQIGRTVFTFVLKYSRSNSSKHPNLRADTEPANQFPQSPSKQN